jgi:hypothetical protein
MRTKERADEPDGTTEVARLTNMWDIPVIRVLRRGERGWSEKSVWRNND